MLGTDGVLAALAAGDGEKADVGVEAVRKIAEQAGCFVVGMRGDEEDARGDAGFIDGFDGFGEGLGAERGGCQKADCSGGNAEYCETFRHPCPNRLRHATVSSNGH